MRTVDNYKPIVQKEKWEKELSLTLKQIDNRIRELYNFCPPLIHQTIRDDSFIHGLYQLADNLVVKLRKIL